MDFLNELFTGEKVERVPGQPDYFITSFGRIFSQRTGGDVRELTYARVKNLPDGHVTIPNLVYEVFKGEAIPPRYRVDTVDSDLPYEFRLDNLQLSKKKYKTKLTPEDVRGIRSRYETENTTYRKLADAYDVSYEAVRLVVKGELYPEIK